MHFALNLIFFLFFTWVGAIIHALCIVASYGFGGEEMPRVKRKAQLRAQQKGIYNEPAPPPAHYDTRPAYSTESQDAIGAENVYVAGHADSGSAFARGSVNTTRGDDGALEGYPSDEATQGGNEYGMNTHDFGEDQKFG